MDLNKQYLISFVENYMIFGIIEQLSDETKLNISPNGNPFRSCNLIHYRA